MQRWQQLGVLIAIGLGVCLLFPKRRLGPDDPGENDITEIVFMGPGGPLKDALADVVHAFEADSRALNAKDPSHPIYRVVAGQNAARDQVADPTRFLLSVAGGVPPDVIWFDRYAVAEWAGRGAFAPLDAFIEEEGSKYAAMAAAMGAPGEPLPIPDYPWKERYYEACWNEAICDGKVYGIPISVDNRALFYNKDLLIKAGLVYTDGPRQGEAKPPRTWKELREYNRRLTEWEDSKKGRLKVMGFPPHLFGNTNGWLYMFGWMNGGEFMSDDGRTCTLNDPRIADALQFMKDLHDDLGGYENATGFAAGFGRNDLDPFIRGQLAMKIDGSWVLRRLAVYGADVNFGIAAPPLPEHRLEQLSAERREQHLTMSWSGGWALAIPELSKNKRAAWNLIRFMSSDRGMQIKAEAERLIDEAKGRPYIPRQCPVKRLNEEFYRDYVVASPTLPPRLQEAIKVFKSLLPYSRFRPVTPVGQKLWNAQVRSMENAFYGEDPQAALDYLTLLPHGVQKDLDRFYAEKSGRPIPTWNWFFILYGVLIVAVGAMVYGWDTNVRMRETLSRLLPFGLGGTAGVIRGARGGYFRQQWREGIICASPWVFGFIVFGGGPMLFSIVMSLCDYDVINTPRFNGGENYIRLVDDRLFWKSLGNTVFMLLGVPIGIIASLLVAMLLNLKIRGIALWRTFFYLPAIVPLVAASVLWIWIFNPTSGALNSMLEPLLNLVDKPVPNWLQDENWSKPSIILMGLWSAGASMIIWLAGLKSISPALYEAASVDGANAWQRFWHITIPQLTPYIFFNLVMGLISTFQIFGQAFIMTQGGPRDSTLFYVYYLFNNAFRYGEMGYASSMAWVLFVIVLLLTTLQLKYSKRWVHYEA